MFERLGDWLSKMGFTIMVIGIVALLAYGVFALIGAIVKPVTPDNPAVYCSWYSSTFLCKDIQVEECAKSDRYSREECVALVGGGGNTK